VGVLTGQCSHHTARHSLSPSRPFDPSSPDSWVLYTIIDSLLTNGLAKDHTFAFVSALSE